MEIIAIFGQRSKNKIDKAMVKCRTPNEQFHESGGICHSRQVKDESLVYQ